MDKSWVWLPRASLRYEIGASDFVHASARCLGNPSVMLCPCIDCRNLCHQPRDTVLDHLVTMDTNEKYKRNLIWSKHGEKRTVKPSEDPSSEFDAYDLIRTTFFNDDSQTNSHSKDQREDGYTEEEFDFRRKLEDVETPLCEI